MKDKKVEQVWRIPAIPPDIPAGDMPGDKVQINDTHIEKAGIIFPLLLEKLAGVMRQKQSGRAVVSVCGGSGVGKSEIASLLSFFFNNKGVGCYTLSGDNYPRRIPLANDAERLRVFRAAGLRGLLAAGEYTPRRFEDLRALQQNNADADPAGCAGASWLGVYQNAGKNALKGYLGTPQEIDFEELNAIVTQFNNGAHKIWLKRMGRHETELWYDEADFGKTKVLFVEWTHGNSNWLQGVDVSVLLNSTPQETLAHRRARGRDGGADSAFTTMVLQIEQDMLRSQAKKAGIILSKNGKVLSYEEYCRQMEE